MSDDPMDLLFVKSLAMRDILRHLVGKVARESGDQKQWVKELHDEITTLSQALEQERPSEDGGKLRRDVDAEINRFFRVFIQ